MQREATHTQFAAALLDPHAAAPMELFDYDEAEAARRFAIHRNNIIVSLIDALRAQYPSTERLIGAERFRHLARQFVREFPPVSPVLLAYGGGFAEYLAGSSELSAYPFVADVAAVEWAWMEAYHAADATILQAEAFATLDPDALAAARFQFHPAARLISSRFAAGTLYIDNRANDDPPPRDVMRSEDILVTRPGYEVQVRVLRDGEHAFLTALQDGASFGDAAGRGAAASNLFDLTAAIVTLVESGATTALLQKDTP